MLFKVGDTAYFKKESIEFWKKSKTTNFWQIAATEYENELFLVVGVSPQTVYLASKTLLSWGMYQGVVFEGQEVKSWVFSPVHLIKGCAVETSPAVCKCPLSFGCTCGVFKTEMESQGKTYNPLTKEWES